MMRKEMVDLLWEAKMLGKWVPCEGESIEEAYDRVYGEPVQPEREPK